MSRTRDVANAIIAKLGADAELLSLMPNGVYRANRGPEGATALVEVGLGGSTDHQMFGGRADEDLRYMVQAIQRVGRGSVSKVGAAAQRIDSLLDPEDGSIATLDIPGMGVMVMQRLIYLEDDNVTDPRDPTIAWDVCGGIYQVMVTKARTTPAPPSSVFVQPGWTQPGFMQ